MPRIRTLKPEHRQHRKIGPLSDRAYRLWVGMICEADDDGRLVCDPQQLRALVFAYHPGVTVARLEVALAELEAVGLVRLYTVGAVRYADFPSWRDHQVISKRRDSKLPPYQHSRNVPVAVSEHSRNVPAGSEGIKDQGSEGKGGECEGNHRTAPAPGNPSACASTSQPAAIAFRIPNSIQQALSRAPRISRDARVNTSTYWQAEVRANPGVRYADELLKAEAWLTANGTRPRKDLARFLHNWLSRAERTTDG